MLDQATRLREIAEKYCERPAVARPHILTITGGKGGVGKSTLALNLAIRFAELKNNTLLIDADENLGNLDVMAGVSPERRLGHVLRGECDLEAALVSPMKNLCMLAGSSGEMGYRHMTMERRRELLADVQDLEQRFDHIVLDTAAGIGEDVVSLAVQSHETIVVTQPEPTAVMDAYALIKMITLADPMAPLSLIVNAAHSPAEADDTATKLRQVVHHFLQRQITYLGSIPFDRNVSKAVVRQHPLVKEFPATSAALSIGMIAERICEHAPSMLRRRIQTP
ncbi:MAG: MinD/ParA family protein [Ignavibacteriae bacterium]|nr:MinD/ParA family protein [Ignavibacteriota bacterium]